MANLLVSDDCIAKKHSVLALDFIGAVQKAVGQKPHLMAKLEEDSALYDWYIEHDLDVRNDVPAAGTFRERFEFDSSRSQILECAEDLAKVVVKVLNKSEQQSLLPAVEHSENNYQRLKCYGADTFAEICAPLPK